MTPAQLAKESESSHQKAVFAWANMAARHGIEAADDELSYLVPTHAEACYGFDNAFPELKWLHHIPNGGSRGDNAKSRAIQGAKLKAEGVKTGVPDLFLPKPKMLGGEDYDIFSGKVVPIALDVYVVACGLYIEMKKPSEKPVKATSKGGVSDAQREFINYAQNAGYIAVVCYNWIEAVDYLRAYCNRGF